MLDNNVHISFHGISFNEYTKKKILKQNLLMLNAYLKHIYIHISRVHFSASATLYHRVRHSVLIYCPLSFISAYISSYG